MPHKDPEARRAYAREHAKRYVPPPEVVERRRARERARLHDPARRAWRRAYMRERRAAIPRDSVTRMPAPSEPWIPKPVVGNESVWSGVPRSETWLCTCNIAFPTRQAAHDHEKGHRP